MSLRATLTILCTFASNGPRSGREKTNIDTMPKRLLRSASILVACAGMLGTAVAQTDAGGQLLQPGEPYPGTPQEPIHLHLPTQQPSSVETGVSVRKQRTQEAAKSDASVPASATAEAGEAARPLSPKRTRQSSSTRIANTAPASGAPVAVPFSFDGSTPPSTSQTQPSLANTAPSAARTATAPPASHAAAPPAASPPTRQASIETSRVSDRTNLAKRGAILFEKGALAPSPVQYQALKVLAGNLNNALESGASGIQLEAYGGTPGDKSSDARRTSLKRALSVRQLLIDDGVPSARIIVKAMGGVEDKGPTDRVDVFVHTS